MYDLQTSYTLLRKYIRNLIATSLLVKHNNLFKTTSLGLKYCDHFSVYKKVRETLAILNAAKSELEKTMDSVK